MKKPASPTRIMVFGTFDFLHKGHLHFFKQARALAKNPFLIVSVARDKNVRRIKKFLPSQKEKLRLDKIKKLKFVDAAVLGALKNPVPHILKQKPQIIALGYDQDEYIRNLQKTLAAKGLKVKIATLKPHKPHVYKSSLLKRKSSKIVL